MTERDRLWEEAGNVDPVDGDKVLRAETLKEQIIGMVASSGEVLVMLVQYRRDSHTLRCADARASQEARICTEVTGDRQAASIRFGVPAAAAELPHERGLRRNNRTENSHRAHPLHRGLELRECSRILRCYRRCNSDPGRRLKSDPASRLVPLAFGG